MMSQERSNSEAEQEKNCCDRTLNSMFYNYPRNEKHSMAYGTILYFFLTHIIKNIQSLIKRLILPYESMNLSFY